MKSPKLSPAELPRRRRLAHFELAPGQHLEEPVRLAWVDSSEELAVRVCEGAGLDHATAVDFGVAVREAVMNALRHGAKPDRTRVAVSFELAGPELVVSVRDRGNGFDPDAAPDPLEPQNLQRGSGRGLFYMRKFADQVSFSFPRAGGTVARLHKRLPVTREGRPADPAP